jgi:hypothetical protein
MELELAMVRVQGQAWARVRQPQSVLVLMRPSVLAPVLPLAQVRMGVLGLVQAPVRPLAQGPTRPRVRVLAVLSGMEPVMALLMVLGTKGSGLKTEPVLELQNNALDPPTFET